MHNWQHARIQISEHLKAHKREWIATLALFGGAVLFGILMGLL